MLKSETNNLTEYTQAFQRGEEIGFGYFFNSLHPALLYYAFRILNDKASAEDVVEESFIKIWERHSSFSHPQVIKSWLYTTVRNASLNLLKQEQSQQRHQHNILREARDVYQEPHINQMITAEVCAQVYKAIQVLPKECRRVFRMMFIEGKKARQIAEELGLSISTVKNQKARGLEILRHESFFSNSFSV